MHLVNPKSGNVLSINMDRTILIDEKTGERFPILENDVVSFLNQNDTFYEGSYLNNVKYLPQSEKWYHIWPLWGICNGYLWEVRKQFQPGATLLEIGCAGGVDYFGARYNMIGLDLSYASLKILKNYNFKVQANALHIPVLDQSLDGIISSYFWEHIPPYLKDTMLKEFKRTLKPDGKIVFLYDVATKNRLINKIKRFSQNFYQREFIDRDGHFGYESVDKNAQRFMKHGFTIEKHFGMERTIFQSASVYEKLSRISGLSGTFYRYLNRMLSFRIFYLANTFMVRLIDSIAEYLLDNSKSRIIITVAKKS